MTGHEHPNSPSFNANSYHFHEMPRLGKMGS